ncbi:hypothetical protein TSUD_85220 [Trifolium subterraneum]|uniref:RRM domain-containing protein n=1 Tax=Trifolium subterraneum TaxID=3900 RepID=A0A2Z6MD65_TRISU|nr:hypothetical protein TSUD_85220 [Trifolium subterraneum]
MSSSCPNQKRLLPGFVRKAQEESVSFFFTNFPLTEDVVGLRKLFCSFVSVGDVFIPSKMTKFGQRFGFVRFHAVPNVEELLSKLQDIWLGTYKLRVNVSKFGRDSSTPLRPHSQNRVLDKHGIVRATPMDGRSFIKALTCNEKSIQMEFPHLVLPPPPANRSLVGDVSNERLAFLAKCLVGYLKTNVDLFSLMDSLVLHGLQDISVCPMGGSLVLISSKKIANSFGEFVMMDENTLKEISFVRGRVKVLLPVTVSSVDEVVVVVTRNGDFPVKVMEEMSLLPVPEASKICRDRDSCVGNDSEALSQRSIPSDDGFSDGEFENGEEDEIQNLQHVERNSVNRWVGAGDKSALSCQQLFLETNKFAALAIFDEDTQEKEAESERRREVSVTCQNKRDGGATSSFLNCSKSTHNLNNVECFEENIVHIIDAISEQPHGFASCVGHPLVTHVAGQEVFGGSAANCTSPCTSGSVGLIPVGPLLQLSNKASSLEGGVTKKFTRLVSVQNEKGHMCDTPLHLTSIERSRMSSPSPFSSFLLDLPPETVVNPPVRLKGTELSTNNKKPLFPSPLKVVRHLNLLSEERERQESSLVPSDQEEIESVEEGSFHFDRPLLQVNEQVTVPPNFKKPLLSPSRDRFLGEGEWGDTTLVRPALGGHPCSSLALCADPGMTPTHFSVGFMLENGEPVTHPEGIGDIQGRPSRGFPYSMYSSIGVSGNYFIREF